MWARAASGIAAAALTAALIGSLTLGGGGGIGGASPDRPNDAATASPSDAVAAFQSVSVAPDWALPPAPGDAASGASSRQSSAPAAGSGTGPVSAAVPVFSAAIVRRFPHDPQAFTQGLVFREGALFESVGREGRSEVRRVDLATGRVLARAPIPADQFGEGLAAHGRELVSLTWKNGVAYRWDAATLKGRGTFRYAGEGWGLAGNGRELALSDGTPTLRFMDASTFAERRRVTVTFRGAPVSDLNELEWVGAELWGNIWHQPFLVRIDPATGRVTALADLRPLVREVGAADPEAVANGIAHDPATGRLFLTGKLWPTLFEVRLAPAG